MDKEELEQHIKKFEEDVSNIRRMIDEAKEKLKSGAWSDNELMRTLFEGAISVQEAQLEIAIQHHKDILELSRMG